MRVYVLGTHRINSLKVKLILKMCIGMHILYNLHMDSLKFCAMLFRLCRIYIIISFTDIYQILSQLLTFAHFLLTNILAKHR